MGTIGIVGVGMMGLGIATNLQRHGHALNLLEHPGNQPLDGLKQGGARTFGSAAALAAASDTVILVLTGSPQVEAVLTGADGVLEGLRAGSVVMDCTTAIPASTRRMAQAVQATGGHFLDTAMTRTPKEAMEGRLNLLVGGEAALLETCRPVMRCYAEHIFHAGPVGAGHAMKLLHNYVSLGMVSLLSEAAACARQGGVGLDVFVDVLAKGGAGGTALERVRPYLLSGDPSGLRFTIANALKDLGYYRTMAGDAGAAQAIAEAVQATLALGLGRADEQTLLPELVDLISPGALPVDAPARA
jgi:3-hydroxyisobutyrate dehydrogenase-like beta-hydroxyacid dehydrogenase